MTVLVIAFLFTASGIGLAGQATSQTPPLPAPQPITEGFGVGAYRPQPGIIDPVPLKKVEPRYTSAAVRAKIQGEVHLEAVIMTDGTIGDVIVSKSLDNTLGLDDEAVKAAKQWHFRPATYHGKPVPVVVTLILEFRVRSRPEPNPRPYWLEDAEFLKGVARLGQPNVTMPILERAVEPKSTSYATRMKIAGSVTVDMVVGTDGKVMRARIVRSLDPALDYEAIEAARLWEFKPGLVSGQPAPVLVTALMEFRQR